MSLLYLALATLSGVLLGQMLATRGLFGCGWPPWLWLIPAALLALTPWLRRLEREPPVTLRWPASAGFRAPRRRPSPALVAACGLGLTAGVLRMAGDPLYPCWAPTDLAYYNQPASRAFDGRWVTVTGHVSQYVPMASDRTRLYVAANAIDLPSGIQPVQGQVTLLTADAQGLQYGDPVRLRGVLSIPPEFADFSYRDYLARRDVYSQMAVSEVAPLPGSPQGNAILRALYAVRAQGEALIGRSLPEPYAALANGILLGIDANIPDDLQAAFNDTSATHVLVISGSNIALITGVLLALGLYLFGRRGAALWAVAGIALYALLVGGEPSVARAALMGSLVVIAVALDRQSTALVSLGVASLVLVLANPHTLWDVGFQLSALATAGLVLLAPRISQAMSAFLMRAPAAAKATSQTGPGSPAHWRRGAWALGDALAITLAASLAVTPLLLYYFQRLSLIGLLANLLIAPVQPLILFAGMGALAAGLAGLTALSLPLFWVVWVGLAWTVGVVERAAAIPWASTVIGGFNPGWVAAAYALMGLLLWQGRRQPIYVKPAPRLAPAWQRLLGAPATLASLAAMGVFLWNGMRFLPDGRLHLYALRADSGLALLIQTSTGRQALIDGGDDAGRLLNQLGAAMGPWDRTLDLAVLSRDHARTAAAQAGIAGRLRIDHAQTSAAIASENLPWATALADAGAALAETGAGGWVDLGDGVALWTLAPAAGEKGPLALWLEHGDFAALIAGAVPRTRLAGAGWALPRSPDLLLLPDAGAKGEERAAFVAEVAPRQVIAWGDAALTRRDGNGDGADKVYFVGAEGPAEVVSDGSTWSVIQP